MVLVCNQALCTAKNPPRNWEMDDGRSGTSYKVEISDGSGNVNLACVDEDIYNKFHPFRMFDVIIELVQTSYEGRKGVKAQIIDAVPADMKEFLDSISGEE